MKSFFFSLAMFCTARPTADTGTSTIRSTCSTSYQRRAMPPPMSGLSWWSPTTTLIGLPSTLPPKSSIAICTAVTEPWPVGVEAGPFMSVSTPILTTSSETCASAADDASIAAAPSRHAEKFLKNILFPPWSTGALAALFCGGSIAPIGPICNYFGIHPFAPIRIGRRLPPVCPHNWGHCLRGTRDAQGRERYLFLYFTSYLG